MAKEDEDATCAAAILFLDPTSGAVDTTTAAAGATTVDPDGKLNVGQETGIDCSTLKDAEDCSMVTVEECGTLIRFGTINVTTVCPVLCLCDGSIKTDLADDLEASANSPVVAIAAGASAGAVVVIAIIMFFIMRPKKDSDDHVLAAAAAAAELNGDGTLEMTSVSDLMMQNTPAQPNVLVPAAPGLAATTASTSFIYSTGTVVPSDDIYGPVKINFKNLFTRVVLITCEMYAAVAVNPLAALANVTTPTSIKVALKAAAVHCGNLDIVATAATTFAEGFDLSAFAAPAALALIHVAIINAYTQESPLYGMMNATLGGYGKDGRKPLKHYLPVTKLLNDSLKLIKPVTAADGGPVTLYRGVKMPASVLLGDLKEGDILTWWSFTSTTLTSDVLQSTDFLGIGKKGAKAVAGTKRTVFHIKAFNGINVKPFSAISDEDEVLLRPGSQFVIDGISEWHYGITEIRMHQVPSTVMPMDDEAADAGLYDAANSIYDLATASPVYDAIDDYMVPVPINNDTGAGSYDLANEEPADMHANTAFNNNNNNDNGAGQQNLAVNIAAAGTMYTIPLEDGAASAASETMYATLVEDGASAASYEMPDGFDDSGHRRKTAMRCARPSPSGGTCKKVQVPNGRFCKAHACPQCGGSKSSSAAGCQLHPAGLMPTKF